MTKAEQFYDLFRDASMHWGSNSRFAVLIDQAAELASMSPAIGKNSSSTINEYIFKDGSKIQLYFASRCYIKVETEEEDVK